MKFKNPFKRKIQNESLEEALARNGLGLKQIVAKLPEEVQASLRNPEEYSVGVNDVSLDLQTGTLTGNAYTQYKTAYRDADGVFRPGEKMHYSIDIQLR